VELDTVEVLSLQNKQIDDTSSFARFIALTTLDLRNNRLQFDRQVKGVFDAPRLSNLNLTGNAVCKIKNYRAIIITACPNLTILDDIEITEEERQESDAIIKKLNEQAFDPLLNVSVDDSDKIEQERKKEAERRQQLEIKKREDEKKKVEDRRLQEEAKKQDEVKKKEEAELKKQEAERKRQEIEDKKKLDSSSRKDQDDKKKKDDDEKKKQQLEDKKRKEEEEKKKLEEKRKQEEEGKKKQAEERKKQEETRKQEDAEKKKQAEERKKQEDAKKKAEAEQKKNAEAEQKKNAEQKESEPAKEEDEDEKRQVFVDSRSNLQISTKFQAGNFQKPVEEPEEDLFLPEKEIIDTDDLFGRAPVDLKLEKDDHIQLTVDDDDDLFAEFDKAEHQKSKPPVQQPTKSQPPKFEPQIEPEEKGLFLPDAGLDDDLFSLTDSNTKSSDIGGIDISAYILAQKAQSSRGLFDDD